MKKVDLILSSKYIIPIVPRNVVLRNYSIVINNGIIDRIDKTESIQNEYETPNYIELGEQILLPGFVNTHTHSPMVLLRGIADDCKLETWLNEYIWPIENHFMSEEYIRDGSMMAIAEMIRCGTTCFNEHYFLPWITAEVSNKVGIRCCIGAFSKLDTVNTGATEEYMSKCTELYQQYKDSDMIRISVSPHAPYTVSDDGFRKVVNISDKYDIPIHIHIHETETEILNHVREHGIRPIARMKNLGLIDRNLIAVHCTQLNQEEIDIFGERKNTNVIHCPKSNLKLASGFCPVRKLLDSGTNVSLGTDSAASNNNLDILDEAKISALLMKCLNKDASIVKSFEILEMLTINGAKSIGFGSIIGSFEIGKRADMISIDINAIETKPYYDCISSVLYSISKQNISNVWIDSNCLMRNRELVGIDADATISISDKWNSRIKDKIDR